MAFIVVIPLLPGQQLLGRKPAVVGNRVTILYDAFGRPSAMIQDWGYSAFVEYAGKRILFDIGNNPSIFARNVRTAGVEHKKLDFVQDSLPEGCGTSQESPAILSPPARRGSPASS